MRRNLVQNGSKNESTADGRTSDSGTTTKTCAYCGAAINTNEWYPVTTGSDEDGNLQIYSFCGESCRNEWCDE